MATVGCERAGNSCCSHTATCWFIHSTYTAVMAALYLCHYILDLCASFAFQGGQLMLCLSFTMTVTQMSMCNRPEISKVSVCCVIIIDYIIDNIFGLPLVFCCCFFFLHSRCRKLLLLGGIIQHPLKKCLSI